MPRRDWVIMLHDAADEVFWAAKLNLLWLLSTLLGGIVLGVGPATLAAYTVARRHATGETFRIGPAFATAYRRELVRGSVLVLPLLGAATLLVINYATVPAARPASLAAGATLAVIAAYLLPMAVHYHLRAPVLLPRASLLALSRPASSVLLLFAFVAFVFAGTTFPFLALAIAAGGWIQLDTWLCLRFFAENEARLRAESTHDRPQPSTPAPGRRARVHHPPDRVGLR